MKSFFRSATMKKTQVFCSVQSILNLLGNPSELWVHKLGDEFIISKTKIKGGIILKCYKSVINLSPILQSPAFLMFDVINNNELLMRFATEEEINLHKRRKNPHNNLKNNNYFYFSEEERKRLRTDDKDRYLRITFINKDNLGSYLVVESLSKRGLKETEFVKGTDINTGTTSYVKPAESFIYIPKAFADRNHLNDSDNIGGAKLPTWWRDDSTLIIESPVRVCAKCGKTYSAYKHTLGNLCNDCGGSDTVELLLGEQIKRLEKLA